MQEFVSQIGIGPFIALVAVVGGLLIPLTAIVGSFMYKHRRLQVEAALKHDMLERGMSAEDIERVLEASTSRRRRKKQCGSNYGVGPVDSKPC
jgi:hypothetical protein